ncbi:HCL586Wp [Eremothecium sinecaudum]|uniref:Folic acid synthesis protein FOL1 n=1 Tax=Eremothecium sinecaudum TaxID=45286 RepID=A0A109UXZ5_9SACH|nr:HCL586Wp [Eremothecium sinecaudum]AMD19565.1 HCL586Wp [Eremothecium sinecaudum]
MNHLLGQKFSNCKSLKLYPKLLLRCSRITSLGSIRYWRNKNVIEFQRKLSSNSGLLPKAVMKSLSETEFVKTQNDKVHVEKLMLNAVLGPDAWDQYEPQNFQVSMDIGTDFGKCSKEDDLKYSLNYAVLCRDVTDFVKKRKNFASLGQVARDIHSYALGRYPIISDMLVTARSESSHIRCDNLIAEVYGESDRIDQIRIANLKVLTVIGVFTFERYQKQYVDLEITLPWMRESVDMPNCRSITNRVVEFVEESNFKTVEALVESIAQLVLQESYFQEHKSLEVNVKVLKLNAITQTKGVGVSCVRKASDFIGNQPIELKSGKHTEGFDLPVPSTAVRKGLWGKAILAFGSNIGDRFANIERALAFLNEAPKVKVLRVSSLFESVPMYYRDQDIFLNGVVEISTELEPEELLKLCKDIEYNKMNRFKEFDNGPRVIDLDIIRYKNSENEDVLVTTKDLVIPHPRILERTFVLEPLCELVSVNDRHPITAEPYHNHLKQLYSKGNKEDLLWKVVPLPTLKNNERGSNRFLRFKREFIPDVFTGELIPRSNSETYVMGILNVTPDSFSDGCEDYKNVTAVIERAKAMVNCVLSLHSNVIVDIGGCSTRPGSLPATLEEELERTIPIIRALRKCDEIPQEKLIISIDTFRSEVARQAVEAGIDIINDISGGQLDPEILSVAAANPHVAYVLSHNRFKKTDIEDSKPSSDTETGDEVSEFILGASNNSKETSFIRGLCSELADFYLLAMKHGVKRWQLILDPGIGFGKVGSQNMDIIRQTPLVKNYSCLKGAEYVSFCNIPVLLGPSRKKFIGTIIQEVDAGQRDFATGAIVACSVGFDADIVRVHDVVNCSKTTKLADALYKHIINS